MRNRFGLVLLGALVLVLFGGLYLGYYGYYGNHLGSKQGLISTPVLAKPAATQLAWEGHLQLILKDFPRLTHSASVAASDLLSEEKLEDPYGIALAADGTVFVSEGGEHNRILKISPQGVVSLFAGGREGFADTAVMADGRVASAQFNTPSGIALDRAGNLIVADTGNHAIRKISPSGQVTTLAGDGQAGYRDGVGVQAQFNGPLAVAVDGQNRILVADTYNDKIRVIDAQGQVTTLAGGDSPGLQDGVGRSALFDTPSGIAVNRHGEIFVADTRNHAIRKIDATAQVTTVVASEREDYDALLRRPVAITVTHDDYLYVGEISHGRILQLAPGGKMQGLTGVDIDIIPGDDTSPRLHSPTAMVVDAKGELLIADGGCAILSRFAHGAARALAPASISISTKQVAPVSQTKAGENSLWPIQPQDQAHEVVGTMGEVRGNYDGESRDHFHRGLDVAADVGEGVFVIRAEKVLSPIAAWGATSINEGILLNHVSYIHMRVGRDRKDQVLNADKFQIMRDPKNKIQQVRIRRGTRFAVGEKIGSVNAMAHVHLNLVQDGLMVNPLDLNLMGFQDQHSPHIERIQLQDKDGHVITEKKGEKVLTLSKTLGEVSIIVDAFDQVDGNESRRRLGLYQIAYQILLADGRPAAGYEQARTTLRFDALPVDEDAVKVVYAENSGITVHGNARTRFLYNVTNELIDGHARTGAWSLRDLASGEYIVRIFASDYSGNRTQADLRLRLSETK